ncbi:Protein of unknown function [Bacillus cereus]|nr:Protein of unknown function [Bacillus cereus]SCN36533.1 Protein of unknown function [Bacillus wiedmannii]
MPVVKELKNEANLGNYFIVGFDTNGAFTTEQLVSFIKLIGNEHNDIY